MMNVVAAALEARKELEQLRAKVVELQSSHDALEAKLAKYQNLEPVAKIVKTTSHRYKKGTIHKVCYCDVNTEFQDHEVILEQTLLYALEK